MASSSNPNFDDLRSKLAYRLGELARACSLSTHFVRAQIRKGHLPARKMGTCVIILADDAENWLRNQPLYRMGAEVDSSADMSVKS
jgi:hypothetical protein